jgi:NAD-dependent deacetylase
MKKVVVLTGAGVSAESGIQTFRDGDGLWKKYSFEDLASPEGWNRDKRLVLEFYNQRRKIVWEAQPNAAHHALARLESKFDVQIVTQNVDDLHEKAGSKNVLHLHGEIKKARSTIDPDLVYELKGWQLNLGDKCAKGSQLRPHIVWFGEAVPMIGLAIKIVSEADIFLIIGTSMVVYPAASLVVYAHPDTPKYYIDPKAFPVGGISNLEIIKKTAGEGVREVVERLLAESPEML